MSGKEPTPKEIFDARSTTVLANYSPVFQLLAGADRDVSTAVLQIEALYKYGVKPPEDVKMLLDATAEILRLAEKHVQLAQKNLRNAQVTQIEKIGKEVGYRPA